MALDQPDDRYVVAGRISRDRRAFGERGGEDQRCHCIDAVEDVLELEIVRAVV